MRDLSELNINDCGRPVTTPPPSTQDIEAFQQHFNVVLPTSYLRFLAFANGGHPELDAFPYVTESGAVGGSGVDKFFHLTSDTEDDYGVWEETNYVREVLKKESLVAVGQNGGGDVIFLDLSNGQENVYILYRTSENATPKIASNFEDFIDSLFLHPDYI